MAIMEERARNLDGQLSVENLPVTGTRVTLRFTPIAQRGATIPIHPRHADLNP